MRTLLIAVSLLFGCHTYADNATTFDIQSWPSWAQAKWRHVDTEPQSLALSVVNKTLMRSENAQIEEIDEAIDIEAQGVPDDAFAYWFSTQSKASGLFTTAPASQARFIAELAIIEYQPLYMAHGEPGFWRDTKSTFNRWYEEYQAPALEAHLGLRLQVFDRETEQRYSYTTYIKARACERLTTAAELPTGEGHPYLQAWSRSLIGQLSIASLQRHLYWLTEHVHERTSRYAISKINQGHVEIRHPHFQPSVGTHFLIKHKEDHRALAQMRVMRNADQRVIAYPLTAAPGALTVGDYVEVKTPMGELVSLQSEWVTQNHCTTNMTETVLAANQEAAD